MEGRVGEQALGDGDGAEGCDFSDSFDIFVHFLPAPGVDEDPVAPERLGHVFILERLLGPSGPLELRPSLGVDLDAHDALAAPDHELRWVVSELDFIPRLRRPRVGLRPVVVRKQHELVKMNASIDDGATNLLHLAETFVADEAAPVDGGIGHQPGGLVSDRGARRLPTAPADDAGRAAHVFDEGEDSVVVVHLAMDEPPMLVEPTKPSSVTGLTMFILIPPTPRATPP